MRQLHKRFTNDQIKVMFQGYDAGKLRRAEVQEMLEIGKTRFFALLKKYKQDPENFTVAYERVSTAKLTEKTEAAIRAALLQEKEIVEDVNLPVTYGALQHKKSEPEKSKLTLSVGFHCVPPNLPI